MAKEYNETDFGIDSIGEVDINKDLGIDESGLDVECLQQSRLAYKYGLYLSYRKKITAELYEAVKTIKAELVEKVTESPEKYLGEGKKATIQIVEAFYRNHKKYKKAKSAWINAQYEENIAYHAQQEISLTRKKMLENLINLHNSNYFAGPSMPRDLTSEWMKQAEQKEVDSGVASKMKRKK